MVYGLIKPMGLCLCLAVAIGASGCAQAQSQETSGTGPENAVSTGADCSNVSVDYQNDPTLTPEEKLARMNEAFFGSLNKFDLCQTATQASGGGGSGEGGGGGGAGGGNGTAGGGAGVASSDMSGTEPSSADQGASESAASASSSSTPASSGGASAEMTGDAKGTENPSSSSTWGRPPMASNNGQAPADIPSADNDTVLQAQIRNAAMNEPDPAKRAKLWDEYRKYGGTGKIEK